MSLLGTEVTSEPDGGSRTSCKTSSHLEEHDFFPQALPIPHPSFNFAPK